MFLKREVRGKDGKEHVYLLFGRKHAGWPESGGAAAVAQSRRTQHHADRSLAALHRSHRRGRPGLPASAFQRSGRSGSAAGGGRCEVVLSSLSVRRPQILGDCWLGCRLWGELGLDKFWFAALGDRRGAVEWSKVMELLAVNRLCAPGSELSIHERWFARTANRFPVGR